MPCVTPLEADWFVCTHNGTYFGVTGVTGVGPGADIPIDSAIDRSLVFEVWTRAGHRPAVRCRSGAHMKVGWRRLGRRWRVVHRHQWITGQGFRFRLRPRPVNHPVYWSRLVLMAAVALVLVALGIATSRWWWIVLPAVALLRRRPQTQPRRARDPLALLIAAHTGRAFASRPHFPARHSELVGSGWWVPSEAHAIWLAGYLAVWNDPSQLRVAAPWLSTPGTGISVVFGSKPSPDHVTVCWGPRPAWAMPLRVRRTASVEWAHQVSAALAHADNANDPSLAGESEPLRAVLGTTETEHVSVNLAATPHALITGSTGMGKSELLTHWLLQLAEHNSPADLALVLIDFKGGMTSAGLDQLPHFLGSFSDLNPGEARRALHVLSAVLRQRERALAARGARNISDATGIPRLVVMVDELRSLLTHMTEAATILSRVAAQGRALGVHLLLATQHPTLSPELRTNLPVRIELHDPEQSHSPPPIPGRARLAGIDFQCSRTADVAREVAQIAHRWKGVRPAESWPAALPDELTCTAAGAFGLVDNPEELTQYPLTLDSHHLLIEGPPGSDRSGAALSCTAAALRAGETVWLIGPQPGAIDPRDCRAVMRALTLASASSARVVFDDVGMWLALHDSLLGPGDSFRILEAALRSDARLVLCTEPTAARWTNYIVRRLSLNVASGSAPSGRATLHPGKLQVQLSRHTDFTLPALPVELQPLPAPPTTVLPSHSRHRLILGFDAGGPVSVPPGDVVVVSPSRSQAQFVARQLTQQLSQLGHTGRVVAVSFDQWQLGRLGPLRDVAADAPTLFVRPDHLTRLPHDVRSQLMHGGDGYGIVYHDGRARALRVFTEDGAGANESP